MTVPAVSCFCHFSHFLEVTHLHFLLTQLILFSSWVSEVVEDYIAIGIVFLVYGTQKRNSLKKSKVYRVERSQKIFLDGNAN